MGWPSFELRINVHVALLMKPNGIEVSLCSSFVHVIQIHWELSFQNANLFPENLQIKSLVSLDTKYEKMALHRA